MMEIYNFFNTKIMIHLFSIDTGSQICNSSFDNISNEMVRYKFNQINIWNTNNH